MFAQQDTQLDHLDESEMICMTDISLSDALFKIDILKHQLKMALVDAQCWKECYESSVQLIINYVK